MVGTRDKTRRSPYDNNGGTAGMAVAGEDYVICAADTRMSTEYSIMTRHYTVDEMSPKTLMASAGFMADAATLKKLLKGRCEQYNANNKPIGCVALAQMLSNTLYMRRFSILRV